ncbi:GH15 family glucan-1,4-alpha-glucosidase [Arthrobacter sp. OAP107]
MSEVSDYALVGDLHTAALISTSGSIDWMCLPNFDSPACFAALLDTPAAGRWLLAPAGAEKCTRRRYRPGTLILETEWETDRGSVRVTDFMPVRDEAADVVRIVEGLSGSVQMYGELCLRFDYGHIVPWVRRSDHGLSAVAGPDAAYLTTKAPLEGRDMRTVSEFTVRAGEQVPFVLSWVHSSRPAPARTDPGAALQATEDFWRDWIGRSKMEGKYKDAVERSLITLKGLIYAPTGGIVAAPTTSLPEDPGGSRNWDYRFCWLRDATLTLQSLLAAGYTEEAAAWREWLLRAVAGDPADLQIMYAIDGTRRLPETELPWLAGFEGSKPVRTGNAAAPQLQLDVWGEVLDGLALTRAASPDGSGDDSWDIQIALMEYLEGAWDKPDNGLWEMRGPRRQNTHSKVMAWVAADRMVKGIQQSGLPGPEDRWSALRETIHKDVMTHGFDSQRNTFVQSYGSKELDASLLLIPRVGFLPHDHPRVVGTVEAIQQNLTEERIRPPLPPSGKQRRAARHRRRLPRLLLLAR